MRRQTACSSTRRAWAYRYDQTGSTTSRMDDQLRESRQSPEQYRPAPARVGDLSALAGKDMVSRACTASQIVYLPDTRAAAPPYTWALQPGTAAVHQAGTRGLSLCCSTVTATIRSSPRSRSSSCFLPLALRCSRTAATQACGGSASIW